MSGAQAVTCEALGKRYRRHAAPRRIKDLVFGRRGPAPLSDLWALRGVGFALPRGRMLGVIGRNGAGKSTLLRMIGGVGVPDEGRVQAHGRVGALLDLGLGFHPELTGRENTYVNGVIAGLTRREVAARLDAIAAFAELEPFMDAPLRSYSSGMRMRLGFSIAAHTGPDILLIDEVLAVGDLAFQAKCMERIEHFKRAGTSIVLVSHNLHEVRALCDDALWLDGGRVRAFGPVEEVAAAYEAALTQVEVAPEVVPVAEAIPGGAPLVLHENRFGTLEVELTEVRVPRLLASGQALQVELGYFAHRRTEDPIFQVKLVREDGVVVWDINTLAGGLHVGPVEGAGRLRLRMERQDVAAGKYFVEVGLYHTAWERMFDYHARVYPLRVQGEANGEAVLAPRAQWELRAARPAPVRSEG